MGVLAEIKKGWLAKREEIRSTALVTVNQGSVTPIGAREPVPRVEILTPDGEAFAAPELFRFEMWCSKTGKPFLALAERHDKTLWLIGNERAGTERAGSAWQPGYQHFEIDAHPAWCCPWCGTREDEGHDFLRLLWQCVDPACGAPIHCCGSRRGLFHCACGQRVARKFHRADVFTVYPFNGLRGASGRGRSDQEYHGRDIRFAAYLGCSTGSIVRIR